MPAPAAPGHRDLRLIVTSVGVSALGDMLAMIPVALHVRERTGSGFAVAAFFVALFGPIVLLAGPAGLLVDRVENTRLLAGVSLVQALAAVALAFAGPVGVVLPLVALLGAGAAVAAPAEFSLVPVAAGPDHVAKANGNVETARYLGMTAGPLLGGLLAGAGLTRAALLADAATFLFVAGVALTVRVRRAPAATVAAGDAGRARDGLVHLLRDRILALTLTAATASLAFFSISMTAELFFATDVLHAGSAGYGILLSGWTIGMVLGASTVARRVAPALLLPAALAAIAIQGAGLLGASLASTLTLAALGFATGGVAHGVKNVALRTLIHERVAEQVRGRAFAAYNAARNAAELAAISLGGVLVGAIGARDALLISGLVPLLIGAAALLTVGGRDAAVATPINDTL